MDRLSITITGRLGADPKFGSTARGVDKVSLSVAVEPRNGNDGPTRWFSVKAYRFLAQNAAASLHKGDMVTVRADDLETWTYTDERTKESRPGVALVAYDISASMRSDTLITHRGAQCEAQARGEMDDSYAVSAEESADLSVLAGVTA